MYRSYRTWPGSFRHVRMEISIIHLTRDDSEGPEVN